MPVPFLYNPNEISERRSVNYAKKPGLGMSHPVSQYVHGNDRELSFTMVVNNPWRWGGVSVPMPLEAYIESLYDLTYPIHRGGTMVAAPPTVIFAFGPLVRRVKVTSVEVARKQWNKLLILKRAEISLTLCEIVEESRNRLNSWATYA